MELIDSYKMTESVQMGNTSGCQPTFSIIPPFISTVIKQRLTSRYTIVRTETNLPSSPMAFDTGDKTSRPSSSGSGYVSGSHDENNGINKYALGMEMPADHEVDSGLRWNRVNPALNLLRLAGYEAQRPQCESHLVRTLYLNAIAYLLSALPEDLTSEEAATIRSSLPKELRTSQPTMTGPATSRPARSYLHRLLASSIVYLCLILQFLMPFIKDILLNLYQYERSRRVTERVTTLALSIAERVSRGSVNFGSTVLNMYDGRPRDAALGVALWWLEGLAGGIYEGLGEGMAILGFAVPDSILVRLWEVKREE
ncbi:hypothetical protein BDW59DRAFT_147801 [Aspergillus cavernicola]|uniref:Uncharacterized protein n=1 Tax=Aspergillus cavernicola TaxID=176166 RepID=A0ABR4I8K7_9EURO